MRTDDKLCDTVVGDQLNDLYAGGDIFLLHSFTPYYFTTFTPYYSTTYDSFFLLPYYFLAVEDVDASAGIRYAPALEVEDDIFAWLNGGTNVADARRLSFLASGFEVDCKSFGRRNGFEQTQTGTMRLQFDGGSIAYALLIKAQALIATVGEDIIFVTTCVEFLLGGSANEQVVRYVLLRSRDVGLIHHRAVRRALQNKSRLFRYNLACTESFHHGFIGRSLASTWVNARDDIRRAARRNEEVLVLEVVGSVAAGADMDFFTIIISITAP